MDSATSPQGSSSDTATQRARSWSERLTDFRNIATILAFLLGSGVVTATAKRVISIAREQAKEKRTQAALSSRDFPPEAVQDAFRYYIEHDTSVGDPVSSTIKTPAEPTIKLFRNLDSAISTSNERKHILLLADTGIGKTTALLAYFHHRLHRHRDVRVAAFAVGNPDVRSSVASLPEKQRTVLLLDALDEGPFIEEGLASRLDELMDAAREFRAVVITCRSQFFTKEAEIPRSTGLPRFHSRRLGVAPEYGFEAIYLRPFNEQQIAQYLAKRYPSPMWRARRRARAAVARVPDLTVRPLILAYIDDIARDNQTIARLADAYERIVTMWIAREKKLSSFDGALIRGFSESLAVELWLKHANPAGIQVTADEIGALARTWRVPLNRWQLTGRSLLTRDNDSFRFAHFSILEYLFVCRFLSGDARCLDAPWTDQMRSFLAEMMETASTDAGDRREQAIDIISRAQSSGAPVNPELVSVIASASWQALTKAVTGMQEDVAADSDGQNRFASRVGVWTADGFLERALQLLFRAYQLHTDRITIFAAPCAANDPRLRSKNVFADTYDNPQYLSADELELVALFEGRSGSGRSQVPFGPRLNNQISRREPRMHRGRDGVALLIAALPSDKPFGVALLAYFRPTVVTNDVILKAAKMICDGQASIFS